MKYFVLKYNRQFGYARGVVIGAHGHETRGDRVVFLKGQRVVHQVPLSLMLDIQAYDTQLEAQTALRDFLSQRAGAATFDLEEYGVVRRPKNPIQNPQGGFLAESIRAIVEEDR